MGKNLNLNNNFSKSLRFTIIGLCGGSGAGKGAVGEVFRKHRIHVIDTDELYHEMISHKSDCTIELAKEFGDVILNEDGSVNRQKLGEIVFADGNQDKLQLLNRISHSHISLKCDEIIYLYKSAGDMAVVIDAPVLFESGFNNMCDAVVSVIADKNIRIGRIIERDKITIEKAEIRISKQVSDEFLISHSDYVIYNNSDITCLEEQTEKIISEIIAVER